MQIRLVFNRMKDLSEFIGTEKICETVVTADRTASAMRSGGVETLATPWMIAFMEYTAAECVKPFLDEGFVTVGTHVDVAHLASTPVGMKVTCRAVLTAVDGRKLTFSVEARDQADKIGEGVHERFIVNYDRFCSKAMEKAAAAGTN